MGPLSGNVSVYGQAVVNGAALYLKQVNANGGINGKQIEILTEDEQGDATQAVNCFTKMVDEGMTALIGDVTTTPTLAVVAESADYNMPMVTASATAEAVTYDAETDTVNANVFRATFTDPFQGIKMADYAYQKLGYTKAAVIFKKGADYNEGLAENFVNEFESLGGTIVDQESYSEGDVDFKTQLTTILGKAPETVFCPNYYEEVGQILSQAESVGLTVPLDVYKRQSSPCPRRRPLTASWIPTSARRSRWASVPRTSTMSPSLWQSTPTASWILRSMFPK